jgi:dATP pyrophosphohydrolase
MVEKGPKPAGEFKRPESVLVVVHTRDGQVLLLRRADHDDFWQSVTGSMRWDESEPRVTAVRELREETGIDAGGALRDWQRSHRYEILPQWRPRYAPDVHTNLEHVFSLELPAPVPVVTHEREHTRYEWLDFATAEGRASSRTDREIIAALGAEYEQARK